MLTRFPKCLICPSKASQVHHMSYAARVLLGLETRALVCLCEACHWRIEFDGKRKRSLSRANRELRRLAFDGKLLRWLSMTKDVVARLNREDSVLCRVEDRQREQERARKEKSKRRPGGSSNKPPPPFSLHYPPTH
jgi:hypothetical protein